MEFIMTTFDNSTCAQTAGLPPAFAGGLQMLSGLAQLGNLPPAPYAELTPGKFTCMPTMEQVTAFDEFVEEDNVWAPTFEYHELLVCAKVIPADGQPSTVNLYNQIAGLIGTAQSYGLISSQLVMHETETGASAVPVMPIPVEEAVGGIG